MRCSTLSASGSSWRTSSRARSTDLVDIRAEVDAFAYLLASVSLKPPLAVGLFGDWGSGKTFFMNAVKNRIAQLVASEEGRKTPQNVLPFWKRIVQIDFNAWHYVKGDLWASLVEHVFSQLRVTGEGDDNGVLKRQAHWLKEIEARRAERAEVTEQIAAKKRDQEVAQQRLAKAEQRKNEREEELEAAHRKAAEVALSDEARRAATSALAGLIDRASAGEAGETVEAIRRARAQLERGSVALGAYPRRKTAIVVAALVGLPLFVLVLAQVNAIPVVAQAFAGVSAALAVVAGALRSVTSWTKARLDELEKAEAKVKAELEQKRAKLDEEVRAAAEKVAVAAADVEKLSARDHVLQAEIADLELRKKSVTPGQILGEFVAERVGSTDYRKLLGTAALIQRA